MKSKELRNIESWAKRHGYKFRAIGNWANYEEFEQTGILIEHPYEGPYPTVPALMAHDQIWKYGIKRGYRVEVRGHYNGTAIYAKYE